MLDVNALQRVHALATHPSEGDEIRISLRMCDVGGNWYAAAEAIRIVHAPCRFGGTQPYFICPGRWRIGCGRRVVKLYRGHGFYLCRAYHRISYASQSEDAMARALRRAGKIKRRLGGSPDWAASFPPRPKGMWQRTY
jgi:hypothetical protein